MLCLIRAFVGTFAIAIFSIQAASARAETITVFAAASLKETLEAAGKLFSEKSGTEVRFAFASTSMLAKQIEAGAPADLFASADLKWMDYLDEKKLIVHETRINLLGNELVIVAPQNSNISTIEFTNMNFENVLANSKLATGDVNSVPVGIYAKSAFQKLGLWPMIEPKLVQADNVRAALAFVSRREVELGVVYKTDAIVEKSVKQIAVFPTYSHDQIVYPFAIPVQSHSEAAWNFLAFLGKPEAQAIFESAGFTILKP